MNDLFDWHERARSTDPETSKIAAREANVNKAQRVVLETMATAPDMGWTPDEVEEMAGRTGLWRRFNELSRLGLIRLRYDDDGKVITRPGRSGKQQRVWWLK